MTRWTQEQYDAATAKKAPDKRRVRGTRRVKDPETGEMIDSKREAVVLQGLRAQFRAGKLDMLATQAWFRIEGGRYVADFVTGKVEEIDGRICLVMEVLDAKGYATDVYKRSKRQIEERYGLKITEL